MSLLSIWLLIISLKRNSGWKLELCETISSFISQRCYQEISPPVPSPSGLYSDEPNISKFKTKMYNNWYALSFVLFFFSGTNLARMKEWSKPKTNQSQLETQLRVQFYRFCKCPKFWVLNEVKNQPNLLHSIKIIAGVGRESWAQTLLISSQLSLLDSSYFGSSFWVLCFIIPYNWFQNMYNSH